jgi:hypothetical protein
MQAAKDMNLKAIAHCTLHGYNLNGVYVTVLPAGTTPAQMVQKNGDIAGMQVMGMDPNTAASTATQMVQGQQGMAAQGQQGMQGQPMMQGGMANQPADMPADMPAAMATPMPTMMPGK